MPSYVFMARNRSGVLQTGHLDAVGEEEVVAILQNRGLIVTSLVRKESTEKRRFRGQRNRRLRRGVKMQDKVHFCQELSTLLDAGIPLVKGLEIISGQVESRLMLLAVEQVRQDIEAGMTFRDAAAKHPKIFSIFWINLIETGEASGHLAQSLHQLATYLEAAQELQSKAVTAMTYPIVLIGAASLAIVVFVLKIIPIFAGIFESMHLELPLMTKLIIDFSEFMQRHVLLLAGTTAGAFFLFRQFLRTNQGQWMFDHLMLRLPIFSSLFVNLQLAQFARGFSTLLESGVPILYSLEIVSNSLSNKVYARAIGEVKDFVREGKTMAEPLMESGLFPPMMVSMVQVGEEIGELAKMLDRVAVHYEKQVATFIERMSVLFEPIGILVMGTVIGTLVVAMFLPIFNMAGAY